MLADDSSLPLDEREEVARYAQRALREAAAIGVFPTPVDQILEAAKIEVQPIAIDEGHLAWLRQRAEAAGQALKSALSKLWGVFDPAARTAYIDPETPQAKMPFLKLHEGGHAVLPWQSVFGHFEDCRKTLAPEVKDAFERQANVFASDALFQIDGLACDARDLPFGMAAILKLSRRYGASIYATARRYAATHERCCAAVILDPFEIHNDFGLIARVRRVSVSPSFAQRFANFAWPEWIGAKEGLGRLIPNRRMSLARQFAMADANGVRHEFLGEGFRTPQHAIMLLACDDAPIPTISVPAPQLVLL